jgi:glycosyltransferase involved in cell wall biosynthesis
MAAVAVEQRAPYRFAFVMEQNLGHRTHAQNLARFVAEDPGVCPTWLPIEFETLGLLSRIPYVRSNWSVRASLAAWDAVRRARNAAKPDALFYHTQVTALLSPLHPGVRSVISLDATPINYDTVGKHYGHVSGGRAEQFKFWANQRALARADALVTWCAWARDSLVADYGIPEERITVIAPGVDLEQWPRPTAHLPVEDRLPHLLFVGGDFARKGGDVLLRAFRAGLDELCELHVVTRSPLEAGRNLFIYHDVSPNSDVLRRLYAEADIFVFPSLADCAPLAVPEAMAAGLPVISTRVGAIPEMVKDDVTGLLVPVGDANALRVSVLSLLARPEARTRMGRAGRRVVEADFDARRNSQRLLDVLKAVADRRHGSATPADTRALAEVSA